jgi:asparagine synthase (glutamine-hydrolysing)
MCGIAGICSANPQRLQPAALETVIGCLAHRGPERHAHWSDSNGCLMGHARLSIIDPDPRSDQPFHYGNRYTLVYNGEIYNYVELREELRALGHAFSTTSDTEVLAAAWAAWGPECLERFDGAFAFAIWDAAARTLHAARDRFGEKPFFFHFDGDTLLFGSELKALWKLGAPRQPNDALAYNFITLGYTVNPFDSKETFFRDIYKLPAGSRLEYVAGAPELAIETYSSIDINEQVQMDDAEALLRFRTLFATSVRRRLRSDVPIGTSLSGGLDSSAVAAFCRQEASGSYTHKAFTAVFPGFEKDERALSEKVAKRLGLEQHFVGIDPAEVPGLMERVMRQQEEPFTSGSSLAQYKVFEAARKGGVTVLLDGQGADEVLAGYDKYFRWYWQELYAARGLAASGEPGAARALGLKIPFGLSAKAGALLPHFSAALLEGRKARLASRHPDLNPEWARRQRPYFYYMIPQPFTLNGVLHYNTFTNGLEELLRLADRNSMAHSLEVRLPFLSSDLVRFLFTLPARFKIRGGRSKWLLRACVKDLLPAEVVQAVRKTGFEPPQQQWMQQAAVQEAIRAAREKLVNAGVLDRSVLTKNIQPHSAYAAAGQDWKYWSLSFIY